MIPKHKQFIEAISEKKKVRVQYYSKADSGVIDRVCAPLDYGPGEIQDGVNRYLFWDYASSLNDRILSLVPELIQDVQVLGEVFDPAEFGVQLAPWFLPRDWGTHAT